MPRKFGKNLAYKIILAPKAGKQLKKLESEIQRLIKQALLKLQIFPTGDIKKLQGKKNEFRLRVGIWRIFFAVSITEKKIFVIRILHRKDAYKK